MTHRDELLALKERVAAQEREIDEAKSENELLRAAHAHKTREAETLRRDLDELSGGGGGGGDGPPGPPPRPSPGPFGHRAFEHQVARALRFTAVALGVMMLGTMMLSGALSARARRAQRHVALSQAATVTPLVRTGTVTETVGPEVLEVGDVCTVERIPVAAGYFDCRIEVRCGDQTLYGADPRTGYVRCAGQEVVRDGDTTRFDGDPAMTLDLARDVVTVEERVGMFTQRVRIEL